MRRIAGGHRTMTDTVAHGTLELVETGEHLEFMVPIAGEENP
jgi:hypothetical protein